MKWITREGLDLDGATCVWVIRRFVDEYAVIYYVPSGQISDRAERLDAIPFNVAGVRYGPKEGRTSFDTFLDWYGIKELGMKRLADAIRIVVFNGPATQSSEALKKRAEEVMGSKKDDEEKAKEMEELFNGMIAK